MANEPRKICLGPKALFFISIHGTWYILQCNMVMPLQCNMVIPYYNVIW
jgi:hypothetical protein